MQNHSMFSLSPLFNPLNLFDRFFNPYNYNQVISLNSNPVIVEWTKRAHQKIGRLNTPLIVEMQLYFSCVVKKRVLFSESADFNTQTVNDKLSVAFHTVEAASCDPIEFAKNYPARRELDSVGAKKMHPKQVKIDYVNNEFQGEFYI